MGLPDVRRFPFVEPPAPDDLEASIASLKQLDALTDDEKLTPTGRQLANLPVDVQVMKYFFCLIPDYSVFWWKLLLF